MLVNKVSLDEFLRRVTERGHAARFTHTGLIAIHTYLNYISEAGETYLEFSPDEIARDFLETNDPAIIIAAEEEDYTTFPAGKSTIIHKLGV